MADNELVERLALAVETARHNGRLFALGVVLLTPLLFAGTLVGLFSLLHDTLPDALDAYGPAVLAFFAVLLCSLLALAGWQRDRGMDFASYHAMPGLEREGFHITVNFGLAMLFPHLILESYALLLGSTWLWRELDRDELGASAELLRALQSGDARAADAVLHAGGGQRAKRIIKALEATELIRCKGEQVRLTIEGREFLQGR